LSSSETNWKPLSERLRPEHFDDVVGQYHLTGKNGIIRKALEKRKLFSMILYGAPGTGKTTIGHLIEKNLPDNHEYLYFSATSQRTGELKQLFQRAEQLKRYGTQMVLFVDEIHRLNKAQQDIFLPVTEKGTIILIGATTENPSFEVNPALLSRCRLIILKELKTEDLTKLLKKAIHKDRIIQEYDLNIEEEVLKVIAESAGGDARIALNLLDTLCDTAHALKRKAIDVEFLREFSVLPGGRYTKKGEEHYDLASAFIKSMRGSDPDASVYYMLRMLEGGEDPKFLARRMIIFASEDIGLADPMALVVANAAFQAVEKVGLPECSLNLTEAAIYLSIAPKSNAVIRARNAAFKVIREKPNVPVPLKLRNPVTKMMKKLGYGKDYQYPHDKGGFTREMYLPKELSQMVFYEPGNTGHERKVKERLLSLWKGLKRYRGDKNEKHNT